MRVAPGAMPCPRCESADTKIVTSRGRPLREPSGNVLRGHKCRACGNLFVSIQRIATDDDLAASA